ncbi:MAG: AmmeMemoRadiSam system protein B [Deltaproteobacteria bacterium]|nr:AmmeMemoRadiSam system protein B [Deltaproteobacteria bacterium]
MSEPARLPVAAGKFYTAKAAALRSELEVFLGQAGLEQPALGCMLPHAGYVFSGKVAGLTLARVAVPETVILLGPNHTGLGPSLSLWPGGHWHTPLGNVPVDGEGVESLMNSPEGAGLFTADTSAHLREHSLEVILPFLQMRREKLRIIPLCVCEYNLDKLARAGRALAALARSLREAGRASLLLTSSDMSHYLPHEQGQKLDRLALEQIEKLDPEGLFQVCVREKISMCGFAPMTMMLCACRELGAARCHTVAHTSSGITGRAYGADMRSVVGYAGAVIA